MLELVREESISSKAYALSIAGYSYASIGRKLGLTERDARTSVDTERRRLAQYIDKDERQARMYMEADRLDALQAAYWDSAIAGETKDAELVLKIMDRRSKLFGLDKQVTQEGDGKNVLVIGATKEEFIRILEEAQQKTGEADADIVEGEVIEEDE